MAVDYPEVIDGSTLHCDDPGHPRCGGRRHGNGNAGDERAGEAGAESQRATFAALSGIAVAVLFATGNALWALGWPAAGAPARQIADFYRDTSGRIVVGASLSLVAIAAFVLFAAALRRVLTEAERDDLLATTAFGGALLGMAAGFGAETINMVGALRARDGELTDALAQSLWEIARALGSTAGGVGMGGSSRWRRRRWRFAPASSCRAGLPSSSPLSAPHY